MFQLVSSSDDEECSFKLFNNRHRASTFWDHQKKVFQDFKAINPQKNKNFKNTGEMLHSSMHKNKDNKFQSTPTLNYDANCNKPLQSVTGSHRNIDLIVLMSSSDSEQGMKDDVERSFTRLNLSETLPIEPNDNSYTHLANSQICDVDLVRKNTPQRSCHEGNSSFSPPLDKPDLLLSNKDVTQSFHIPQDLTSINEPSLTSVSCGVNEEIEPPTINDDVSLEILGEFRRPRSILSSSSSESLSPIYIKDKSNETNLSCESLHQGEDVIEGNLSESVPEPQILEGTDEEEPLSRDQIERELDGLATKIRQTHLTIATLSNKLPDGGAKLRVMLTGLLDRQKELRKLEDRLQPSTSSNLIKNSLPAQKGVTGTVDDWYDPSFAPSEPTMMSLGTKKLPSRNALQEVNRTLTRLHACTQIQEGDDGLDLARSVTSLTSKIFKLNLMAHQISATTWMLNREHLSRALNVPGTGTGGILADDMGLGKTLTAIALILLSPLLKGNGEEGQILRLSESTDINVNHDGFLDKRNGSSFANGHHQRKEPTLIVCPASVMYQWEAEVKKYCRQAYAPKILVYHGPSRTQRNHHVTNHDIVITTYALAGKEVTNKPGSSPLAAIQWHRIVLDEGHTIKNPKAQTTVALNKLKSRYRWILTGTPVHNNLTDLYSLLKFLRLEPFREEPIWKEFVSGPITSVNTGSEVSQRARARLALITRALCLRRTKEQKDEVGRTLLSLPQRKIQVHNLQLCPQEAAAYKKIHAVAYNFFQAFANSRRNAQMLKMGSEGSQVPAVYSAVGMLVHLLRMRQCCCHPHLLSQSAQLEEYDSAIISGCPGVSLPSSGTTSLEESMKALSIKLSSPENIEGEHDEKGLEENIESDYGLRRESPMMQKKYESTKLKALLDNLLATLNQGSNPEKCLVVSQWPSFLDLLALHLKRRGFSRFTNIRGSVKPIERAAIVKDFNENSAGNSVLLLSLTAGGVGLNLVGANHVYFADLHWNPALEAQACDRVYRMGQTRPVFVHKFVCANSIEERIVELQERKSALARQIFTNTSSLGTRENNEAAPPPLNGLNKLSLEDMKILFR